MLDRRRTQRRDAVRAAAPASLWHARIAKLKFGLVALAITFGGLTLLLETAELATPIEPWVGYVGFAVSGLSAVVSQVVGKVGPTLREHPRFVFGVLVGINLVYLAIAAVAVATHDDLLPPREFVEVELAAGGREVLRFEQAPGTYVVLRVFPATGMSVTARAQNGERNEIIEEVREGEWELRTVMERGVWRLVITNDGDRAGTVGVVYDVSGAATRLQPGATRTESLPGAAMNGYLLSAEDDGEARLRFDPLSGQLPLDIKAYVGTRITGHLVQPDGGGYEMLLQLEAGNDYVIAVRALDGAEGAYRLRFPREPGFALGPDEDPGDEEPSVPGNGAPSPGAPTLPDLYGVQESEAFDRLRDAGFEAASVPVCSDSVAQGLVRQAFVLTEEGEERVVVDRPGALAGPVEFDASMTIRLKVSTGESCR